VRAAVALLALVLGLGVLPATPGFAGVFTPVSQSREVRADEHVVTTGYACIGTIAGHPFPSCPVVLDDILDSDVQSAPGFAPDPFVASPAVAGASASHSSSVQPDSIVLSGSGTSYGAAAELPLQPGYILVLQTADRTTGDDSTITVDLDEPTPFSFEASGRIDYPDPNIPVQWGVGVEISLTGPGGSVATLTLAPDYACPNGDPGMFLCWVEPTPVTVSGTLPAGQYTLQVVATTEGGGSWYPNVGSLGGFSSAEYSASLSLGPAQPVPGLGPLALAALAAVLVAGSVFRLNSSACPSE